MNIRLFTFVLLGAAVSLFQTAKADVTSVAGFIPLENSGRVVYNFNNGWRFFMGVAENAWNTNFDDSAWDIVSVPHTQQLMPAEASGGRNYQGVTWYRKRFILPAISTDQEAILHFEAIMGKQKFYVNGKLIKEHKGGYLPVRIHLSDLGVQAGDTCLVAVEADNSNDKSYPPGKPQYTLDFSYHGGMYRDVWLICKNRFSITDAIESNKVAGGGVFVHYDHISKESADVYIHTDIAYYQLDNHQSVQQGKQTVHHSSGKAILQVNLVDKEGNVFKTISQSIQLKTGENKTLKMKTSLKNPQLWSPENPYLYRIDFRLMQGKKAIDGGSVRIGIRNAEFRGKDGFWLNGEKYHQLMGGNRHQDFAYVGNALPNSQQWRDVKRLRDAGCTIIRTAHYPQDPSFMDACDELGIFIIVATPGWQYWNKEPEFAELVYQNTRDIIRRDRNHPSVILWEPILNETRFPLDFSLKSLQITKDEFPYPGAPLAAADLHSLGVAENYGVVYGWPEDEGKANQSIFTREFGENVDDWYAHNANNRAARNWGERPMKVAALSLADTYERMQHSTGQFIGGAQWHPFDHQRGYHPDPYWGGIFDAFRQPKYAYYMFKSQVDPKLKVENVNSGPMVFIMNEMTPFSESDVVVFSNCDSVRLTAYDGKRVITKAVIHDAGHIPYAPVIFENQFDFWEMRDLSYKHKKPESVSFLVEGIIEGKVVCSDKKMPSRRSTKLHLYIDDLNHPLVADGSDFMVVVAEVTDDNGNVRRLAKENVVFSVEGEGEIIGDEQIGANPRAIEWGSAPVLIRSTQKAGKITVKAQIQFEGTHAPTTAVISLESVADPFPHCQLDQQKKESTLKANIVQQKPEFSEEQKRQMLKSVEEQQTEFGIKK